MVQSEQKLHKKEGSKKAEFPRFILWISRQKVYCPIELELSLDLLVVFTVFFFLGFGYKIIEKPQITFDNFDTASSQLHAFNQMPNWI